MAYPRSQRSRGFKFATRTSTSLTLNSTTWADVDNTTFDTAVLAQVGDVIECGLAGNTGNEAVASYIDVASIVSAAVVNYWACAGGASDQGVPSWVSQASLSTYFGGSYMRTLVAGDISGGTVTCRLRYRTSTATAKTLYALAVLPLRFSVKNLGPMSPH